MAAKIQMYKLVAKCIEILLIFLSEFIIEKKCIES